jgi:hypothetical protein
MKAFISRLWDGLMGLVCLAEAAKIIVVAWGDVVTRRWYSVAIPAGLFAVTGVIIIRRALRGTRTHGPDRSLESQPQELPSGVTGAGDRLSPMESEAPARSAVPRFAAGLNILLVVFFIVSFVPVGAHIGIIDGVHWSVWLFAHVGLLGTASWLALTATWVVPHLCG